MKILLTGATGGLGLQILDQWQGLRDRKIRALGRQVQRLQKYQDSVEIIQCDLSELSILQKSCLEQDVVIHCAALSSPWGGEQDFYTANVTGTKNILRAAIEAKVKRFIYISTPGVYVENCHRKNISESDPLPKKMINHYAQTKRLAEIQVLKYHELGLASVILRPQAILGVHDQVLIPRFLRVARRGIFPIFGDGENELDLTAASNVVLAIEKACFGSAEITGHIYNITNAEPQRIYPLLRNFLTQLGLPTKDKKIPYPVAYTMASAMEKLYGSFSSQEPPLTRYSVCALGRTRTLNIERARKDLQYSPQISLEQVLKEILISYHGKSP